MFFSLAVGVVFFLFLRRGYSFFSFFVQEGAFFDFLEEGVFQKRVSFFIF